MKSIICLACSNSFTGFRKTRKFCSIRCGVDYRKKEEGLFVTKFSSLVACKNCNIPFTPKTSRNKFCSSSCSNEHLLSVKRSLTAQKNSSPTNISCKECSVIFQHYHGPKPLFCSKKCKYIFFGKKRLKSQKTEKICSFCGKIYFTHHAEKSFFCSRKCLNKNRWVQSTHLSPKSYKMASFVKNFTTSGIGLQIAYGCLMGDGHTRLVKDGLARFSMVHCEAQRGWLEFKKDWMKPFFINPSPSKTVGGEKKFSEGTYKVQDQYTYCSVSHPEILKIHQVFYSGKRKNITNEVLDLLDETSLLVWYLDDGTCNKNKRAGSIATDCFSLEEHLLIQEWFLRRWGIEVKIYEKKRFENKYYNIAFNLVPFLKLQSIFRDSLIYEMIPDCMRYKLISD